MENHNQSFPRDTEGTVWSEFQLSNIGEILREKNWEMMCKRVDRQLQTNLIVSCTTVTLVHKQKVSTYKRSSKMILIDEIIKEKMSTVL